MQLTRQLKCIRNMHNGPGFIILSGTTDPSQILTISLETAHPPLGGGRKNI